MIKRLLLVLLIVIVAIAGWFIYSFYFRTASYEKLVGERLETAVRNGTDSLYRIEYEHIVINPFSLSVSISGIRFYPDSGVLSRQISLGNTPALLMDIKLRNLSFKDLSAKALLKEKELHLSSVVIEEAEILMNKTGRNKSDSGGYNPDSLSMAKQDLYNAVRKELRQLKIDSISILKTHFHYKSSIRRFKEFKISGLNLTLRNILLDSTSVRDSSRFFLAESCTAKLDKYEMPLNELYKIQCSALQLEIPRGDASISDFRLVPLQTEQGFVAKVITDKKRVSIDVPRLHLEGLNASAFFDNELIRARKLILSDMKIDVYHNRHSPKDTTDKVGEYPHQLLMQLDIDSDIREIEVKNAHVSYRQDNPKSGQQGHLFFSRINARVLNVTNNPDTLKKNPVVSMTASGYLLGKTKLQSIWTFYNLDKKGLFSIKGSLAPVQAAELNQVLVPLGMVKLEHGKINSLNFFLKADDNIGECELTFFYENFKVAVLEKTDKGLEEQKSKSAFANKLFLNQDSRPGDKIPDKLKADFKRDPARNLFHMAWNTLLAGLKNTLQYGKPAAKLLKGLKKTEQP